MDQPYHPERSTDWYPAASVRGGVEARFVSHTYGWMFIGLLVTAAISLGISSSEVAIRLVAENRGVFFGALIAELVIVLALSAAFNRLSALTATLGFLLYSALNGLTFSLIFLAYTAASISQVFLLAAGMFGGMALLGSVTKKNLGGLGTFMAMGLWGIILTSVVNLFVKSSALSFGTSVVAIVIFSGLTAYDAQRIRAMAVRYGGGPGGYELERKGAIFGALSLYLDFINLFLSLLRIFGSRKE